MNTNDPKAPYGEQPSELRSRPPVLTEEQRHDLMEALEKERLRAIRAMSEEQRAPLLSDPILEVLKDMRSFQWAEGFREATSIYEAKIASGELMVVKTVKPAWEDGDGSYRGHWECPYCFQRWQDHDSPDVGEFCKCGAKITA